MLSEMFDKIKGKKINKAISENFNGVIFRWHTYHETKIEKVVISWFTAWMILV